MMNLMHTGTFKLSDKEHLHSYYDEGKLFVEIARLERRAGSLCWCHKEYDTISTNKPSQEWVKLCKRFGFIPQK